MEQKLQYWIEEMYRFKSNARTDFELITAYKAIDYLQNEIMKIQNGKHFPTFDEIGILDELTNRLTTIQRSTKTEYILTVCYNIKGYINNQQEELQRQADIKHAELEQSPNYLAFKDSQVQNQNNEEIIDNAKLFR